MAYTSRASTQGAAARTAEYGFVQSSESARRPHIESRLARLKVLVSSLIANAPAAARILQESIQLVETKFVANEFLENLDLAEIESVLTRLEFNAANVRRKATITQKMDRNTNGTSDRDALKHVSFWLDAMVHLRGNILSTILTGGMVTLFGVVVLLTGPFGFADALTTFGRTLVLAVVVFLALLQIGFTIVHVLRSERNRIRPF